MVGCSSEKALLRIGPKKGVAGGITNTFELKERSDLTLDILRIRRILLLQSSVDKREKFVEIGDVEDVAHAQDIEAGYTRAWQIRTLFATD